MKNKEKRQKTIKKNNDSGIFVVNYAFVAITRFLGGTFCSNLVGGGTKAFYTTGMTMTMAIDHDN